MRGDSTTWPSDTGVPPPCHSDVLAVCLAYILLQQNSTKLTPRNVACGRSCAPPWPCSATLTPHPMDMRGALPHGPLHMLTQGWSACPVHRLMCVLCVSLFLCVSLAWSSSLPSTPCLLSFCSSSPVNLGIDLAPHHLLLLGPMIPPPAPGYPLLTAVEPNTPDIFQASLTTFQGNARPSEFPAECAEAHVSCLCYNPEPTLYPQEAFL